MNETYTLPYDADAEEYVLASMLYDPSAVTVAGEILSPEDFCLTENAAVFTAIREISVSGLTVDLISLGVELKKTGKLTETDAERRISELAGAYYTSANVKHHAERVRFLAGKRKMTQNLMGLLQKPEDISAESLRELADAYAGDRYIRCYAEKSMEDIDRFRLGLREAKTRISTGFPTIDYITGGFRVPSVAIIGAYPSVGKTAFAINVASKQKAPIVFFSLEMNSEMIYERLSSSKLKMDYGLFNSRRFTEDQYGLIERFTEEIKAHGFHVFDDAYYIEQQERIIANIKPCLVVVDYIQKVRAHHRAESRRLEIDYISGMYKQLAKQNNCVILLLSQLSRPDKAVKTPKPSMASLKESGALEADGDYVGILHRPHVIQKDDPDVKPEDGYILFDKNKFGNTGKIGLYFYGMYQRFVETDKRTRPVKSTIHPLGEAFPISGNDEIPF